MTAYGYSEYSTKRHWLNATASTTPPTAASRKPSKVRVRVTSSECQSRPPSEIKVVSTSPGLGNTNGGPAKLAKAKSQQSIPSASAKIRKQFRQSRRLKTHRHLP